MYLMLAYRIAVHMFTKKLVSFLKKNFTFVNEIKATLINATGPGKGS